MPTRTDPQLMWVRYSPQTMLIKTTTLSLQAELAHRRLADYAWTENPWLLPDSPAFLVVTRLTPDNLEGVITELKSVGWRIRNRAFFHCDLNADVISSRAFRIAGHLKASAAARTRWRRTPAIIGPKPTSAPCSSHAQAMLKQCSSTAQAVPKHCSEQCTDRQTDRQTDSTTVVAVNGEPLTVNQPVAAASQLSSSTPLQGGNEEPKEAAEERHFLAGLHTALRRYNPALAKAEMTNWGGWWRNAYRTNPDKSRRVLAEISSMITEHRINSNPGAAALDLWKRLPD